MRIHYILSLLCCLVSCTAVVAADAPRYMMTKITDGTHKGQGNGVAQAINNHGEIVGVMEKKAFLWRKGKLVSLKTFHNVSLNIPSDINDSGQIVGTALIKDNTAQYFLWQNGSTTPLGKAPHSIVDPLINGKGQVIFARPDGTNMRAILWQQGKSKDLGNLFPLCLNDALQIGGAQSTAPLLQTQIAKSETFWPVIWENGVAVETGGIGAVWHINNKRQYVYSVMQAPDKRETIRFFLHDGKERISLEPPDSRRVHPTALNERGQIVGFGADESGSLRAIFWENGDWVDLNTLIPPHSGWILTQALDINEKGQIVGEGTHNGVRCAFLLTPVN